MKKEALPYDRLIHVLGNDGDFYPVIRYSGDVHDQVFVLIDATKVQLSSPVKGEMLRFTHPATGKEIQLDMH